MEKYLQSLSAAVCGVCGFLWGQPDGLLYALIAFMVLDYLTGIASAWLRCELSSGVGFVGIAKKVYIMALVAVGHILDVHILGGGAVCRSAVIGFYAANEGISILENAAAIGLPLPKRLTKALEQLKNKEE
ncbi:MAG: phage holin family protein [Ruminococcus sp.]|nr:phage holin family protein [Ruminococcus sp.]